MSYLRPDDIEKLRYPFDVVVLRAEEWDCTFPRILPKTSNSENGFTNLFEVTILLSPLLVKLSHVYFEIQVFTEQLFKSSLFSLLFWLR